MRTLSLRQREKKREADPVCCVVLCNLVRDAAGPRLLQHDGEGLRAVAELRGDEYLHAWECGYDDDGCWDDARAASALRATRDAREAAKKAAFERRRQEALAVMAARRAAAAPPPAKRAVTAAPQPPRTPLQPLPNGGAAEAPQAGTKRKTYTCGAAPPQPGTMRLWHFFSFRLNSFYFLCRWPHHRNDDDGRTTASPAHNRTCALHTQRRNKQTRVDVLQLGPPALALAP